MEKNELEIPFPPPKNTHTLINFWISFLLLRNFGIHIKLGWLYEVETSTEKSKKCHWVSFI